MSKPIIETSRSGYWLDSRETPRTHTFDLYEPFLRSKDPAVREVARKSVLWELAVGDTAKADKRFNKSIKDFFGVDDRGLPTEKALNNLRQNELEFLNHYREMFNTQKEKYTTELRLAVMQDLLWHQAEAMARQAAGTGSLDPKDVEVRMDLRYGLGWFLVVRNRSARDYHHLTVAASVKSKTPDPRNEQMDRIIAGNDNVFADSLAAYRLLKKRPARVFAHLPKLPAGKQWTIKFDVSNDHDVNQPATVSLWADEGQLDRKPVRLPRRGDKPEPPLESHRTSSPNPGTGDLFYQGSIWKGTLKQASTVIPVELEVLQRDGEKCRADMLFFGLHWRYVEGTIKNTAITWEEAGKPRSGPMPRSCKLAAKQITGEFTYFTEKWVLKVDYVPP